MNRTAPDLISELQPGEVIVIGSNERGQHGGGAARYACDNFGLAWGTGEGLSGRTYALPTMEGPGKLLAAVQRFIEYASQHPEITFLLTKVGCGIAGYAEEDVSPLFSRAPGNVLRPRGW